MTILKEATSTLGALNATTSVFDVSDADDVSLQITGTFVGTITFYVSNDGVAYYQFAMHQTGNAAATTDAATSTTTGLFSKKCAPFEYVKAIMTAYTSGSATALFTSSRTSK